MKAVLSSIRDWGGGVVAAWNDFWFKATDPATLCLLRLLAGAMIFYTHLIWSFDLNAFFGPHAWVSDELWRQLPKGRFTWTYFLWIHSTWLLWVAHLAALTVLLMFMLGLFSRVTAVLTYLIVLSYLNRMSLAEFGLDRINVMLSMYLMLGPCGARYSLDSLWRRRRHGPEGAEVPPSAAANIAVRLIQVHMCVIYFFAGARKLTGGIGSWWTGLAMWICIANVEYQSFDMTWLAAYPLIISLMSNLTLFFELSYAALIWPRLTRPVMLTLAVLLHLGIVLALGMPTFGLVMLIGNAAFLSPALVRAVLEPRYRREIAAAAT